MLLPITSIYTAIFAIMMVPLSLSISIHYATRGTHQAVPDILKTDETLRRKTRAHGNFIEYVPLALLLLAMLEISGGDSRWLWIAGGAFFVARIIHVIGHVYYIAGAIYLMMLNT